MKLHFYKLVLIASSLALPSCAAVPVELSYRHELVDQILKPRPGFKGLTNRACVTYDEKNVCSKWEVQDHDLEDAEFRKSVNTLMFICNVGGRRFKVCMDKPGLCRIWYTDRGLFFKRVRHEEYVPATSYQFMLDAKTRCFKKDLYPFNGVGGLTK